MRYAQSGGSNWGKKDDHSRGERQYIRRQGWRRARLLRRLLMWGILAEKNTGFHYSWADPNLPRASYGGVSAGVAKTLYQALSESGANTERHTPNG